MKCGISKNYLRGSYRNTRGSVGEREMLWEHEPQASVSITFSGSLELSLLENTATKKGETTCLL